MFKLLFIFALLAVLLAVYFNDLTNNIFALFQLQYLKGKHLFTAKELSFYNGVNTPFLYLSILGNIFNVTKGDKHYGVGQSYHIFVGRDASKSFVTGKFSKADATDDVLSLSQKDLKLLNNWFEFYQKEYPKIGKLIGRYYDENGKLTHYARQVRRLIRESEIADNNNQLNKVKFPPCNVEWDPEKGSRVWCTNKSGGIERAWVGKPRQYFEPGSKTYRCACISKENEKLGSVKQYEGCNSDSESCFIKD
ncbi:neuferricin homolog [Cylas formicarius]|uniref:neuferricin homolog n=1 Tax=Cylas formicarius TaxID=197179 RepID=UPI002958C87A|nr:neuferricin homolog [Cylas formicarius]